MYYSALMGFMKNDILLFMNMFKLVKNDESASFKKNMGELGSFSKANVIFGAIWRKKRGKLDST